MSPTDWLNSSSTFATVFLGIFVEAAAFLMIGSLASGLVEVFLRPNDMARLVPRNPLAAAAVADGRLQDCLEVRVRMQGDSQ